MSHNLGTLPLIIHDIQNSQTFALLQAAGRAGLPISATTNPMCSWAAQSTYINTCVELPSLSEVGAGLYIVGLKRNKLKGVWFTSMDDAAKFTAKHQDTLKKSGLSFITSDIDTIHQALDTYNLPDNNNVKIAPTQLVEESDIPNIANNLDYPVFIKSSRDQFRKFDNPNHLTTFFSEYDIPCYKDDKHRIQKFIEGDVSRMATAMLLFDEQGKPVRGFTGRRTQVSYTHFGPFGETTAAKAEWIPELYEGARDLLMAIGWKGFAEVECKQAADGQWYVLEVNPRLSGWACLAETDGAGFLQAYYSLCTSQLQLNEACLQRSKTQYARISGAGGHLPSWYNTQGIKERLRVIYRLFKDAKSQQPHFTLGAWDKRDRRASFAIFWYTFKDLIRR
ncbi:MAG: hypothetical protein R8M46_06030 [Ghiorsea sp.]